MDIRSPLSDWWDKGKHFNLVVSQEYRDFCPLKIPSWVENLHITTLNYT